MAHLAERAWVVGVASHQRGHVEGDGQPAAAFGQDHLVPLVGLLGVAEAGELPDGPRLAPIPRRVDASGERVLPRPADTVEALVSHGAVRTVERLDLIAGQRREVAVGYATRGAGSSVALLP